MKKKSKEITISTSKLFKIGAVMSVIYAIVCSIYIVPNILDMPVFRGDNIPYMKVFCMVLFYFATFFFVLISIVILVIKKLGTKKEVIRKILEK